MKILTPNIILLSSSKHAICFSNQIIILKFLKEESEISIQEDFGCLLGNWFSADSS